MSTTTDFDLTARIAVALVALFALSVGMATVTATGTEASAPNVPPKDAFVVTVHENGDANVALVTTFNLTTKADERAFRQFQQNETKRQQFGQQFAEQLRAVVAEVESRTGRDMQVANPTVTVTTTEDGTTGVVAVSIAWTNLAAERNGTLVVDEPFASGFETDRAFILRVPDGYAFAELQPAPESNTAETATWQGGTSLTGFRAVIEPETITETAPDTQSEANDAKTTTGSSGSIPGFGVVVATVALVASALLALGRKTRRKRPR